MIVSIALRPRSSTRVRPPVLRSRWKRSDNWCRWTKTSIGEASHRVHRHRGEQRVAPLLGQRHEDAQEAVEDGQRDGAGQHRSAAAAALKAFRRQRVGRPFERIGRRDRDQLRGQHQRDREQRRAA